MCRLLFVLSTGNDDTLMRGRFMHAAFSVMQLSCTTSIVGIGWRTSLLPLHDSLKMLAASEAPKPWACYFVKEGTKEEADLCHAHGALTLYDVIDNDKRSGAFPGPWFGPVPGIDLWLVNTEAHAALLRGRGLRALALPHPHSNLDVFEASVTSAVSMDQLGILAGQASTRAADAATARCPVATTTDTRR